MFFPNFIYIMFFLTDLALPLIMLIAGFMLYKHPPKNIDSMVGYRSTRAKKNKDTWLFAHNYCGKLWIKFGMVLLIFTAAGLIQFTKIIEGSIENVSMIVLAIQIIILIGTVIRVEKELENNFDEKGYRK